MHPYIYRISTIKINHSCFLHRSGDPFCLKTFMAATKKLGRGTTQNKPITQNATVGGSEIRRSPLDIINIPIMYDSFRNIPGGYLGFLNHQQYGIWFHLELEKPIFPCQGLGGSTWFDCMLARFFQELFQFLKAWQRCGREALSLSWESFKGNLINHPTIIPQINGLVKALFLWGKRNRA